MNYSDYKFSRMIVMWYKCKLNFFKSRLLIDNWGAYKIIWITEKIISLFERKVYLK